MKRLFCAAAALVLASVLLCPVCSAETSKQYSNIYCNHYEDHIEVTGCMPGTEVIEIPESRAGKPVTKIADNAFSGAEIKEVVIPGSVKYIGQKAFSDCINLEKLTLSEGIELMDVGAFEGCTKLSSVTIPESVHTIKIDAFKNCSSLSSVDFPQYANIVGNNIFEGTPFYNNQTGIKYAGNWVIGCDSNVSSVTFKSGTRGITSNSFKDNKLLKSVSIPEGVIRIGSHVFQGCENLKAIDLPDSLTSMGNEVFTGTPLIEGQTGALYVDGWVVGSNGEITSLNIKAGTRGIAAFSFWLCDLTEVTLPQSLEFICEHSFYTCKNLKTVVIPAGVSEIGSNAFDQCYGLEKIFIMNPDCEIKDTYSTFGKLSDDAAKSCDYTLYSYKNSTAQAYAEKYNRRFFAINNYGVIGDFNGDEKISALDASAIFSEYKRSYRGENAKFTSAQIRVCDFNEDGKITASDASYAFSAYKKAYRANGEY